MPVLFLWLAVVLGLMSVSAIVDLFSSKEDHFKAYAQECDKRGGQVVTGFTKEGKPGMGCFKMDELEIDL